MSLPSQVIIIRHAEKPAVGIDLDQRGRQRAAGLVGFLQSTYPAIAYAFATDRSPHSNRSIETLAPYEAQTGIRVDHSFGEHDDRRLVEAILTTRTYDRAVVLVCWHHERIPRLAHGLGATDAPNSWPGDAVFDRVWELTYATGGVGFRDNPQHLLPGDSRT